MSTSKVVRLAVCVALVASMAVFAAPGVAGAGTGWRWLNPKPTGDSLWGVSLDPTPGSDIVWAVGRYGTVQKSYDAGNTWVAKSSGTTKDLMDVDMLDGSAGWAVGEAGTIIKITGGATCTIQPAPAGTDDLYAVDVVDATHAWAVGYNGDIIKTVDGTNWTMVADNFVPNTIFTAVQFTPAGDGWVGGTNNGGTNNIFYVNAAGLLYNKSTADTTFVVDDLAVDVAANTIVAVGRNASNEPLCYKATDTDLRSATSFDVSYGGLPTGLGAPHALTGVAYADSTHMWVSTRMGKILFHNGTSFSEITSPYPIIGYFNDIDFRKDSSPAVHYNGIVVGDGGIAGRTADGGATWAKRSSITGEAVLGLDFVSTTTGYATADTDIIKTTNSGVSWTKLATGQGSSLLGVDFLADGTGWAVGRSGTALYFNGTSWSARDAGLPVGEELYSVCYLDAANVWACGDAGTIAKGNGTSWTGSADADVIGGSWRGIDFFDANHGIAVGRGGKVVYTTDGGLNWTAGVSGEAAANDIYAVDMVSATTAFMVGNDDDGVAPAVLMRKTTDGGATWTPMTPAASVQWETLDDVSFADANNGWIVGGNGTLMRTTNGGSTWTSESMTRAWLSSVSAVSSTAAWSGGYYGALLTNYYPPAPPPKTVVYRFYNMKNGSHFYTDSAEEKSMVINKWPHVYKYEGVSYEYDGSKATKPLWRLYNKKSSSHFYTASDQEKDYALAKWPDTFTLDGPTYAVSPIQVPGSTPVWRLYNKKVGSHFYTASEAEMKSALAKWPDTFALDGVAYYLPQ